MLSCLNPCEHAASQWSKLGDALKAALNPVMKSRLFRFNDQIIFLQCCEKWKQNYSNFIFVQTTAESTKNTMFPKLEGALCM